MTNESTPAVIGLGEGLGAHDEASVRRAAGPWLGKRIVWICATVPWRLQPRGKRARKAKFAALARKKRAWTAAYKLRAIASGHCYQATPEQVRQWLRA